MSDVFGFNDNTNLEKQKRELSCNLRFQLHVSILCARAGRRPAPGYPQVCEFPALVFECCLPRANIKFSIRMLSCSSDSAPKSLSGFETTASPL